MAFRDLIPWSRQENRLPIPVSAEHEREPQPHHLLALHREVNRLFDDILRGFGISTFGGFDRNLPWPHVEFSETDREIRVTAELPGLDEKDVELTVEEGVLTLRGEKRTDIEDRDRAYSERTYGRFERRISLPRSVDRDKATASFKNGVLSVTLPRMEAANENIRRIRVRGKAA